MGGPHEHFSASDGGHDKKSLRATELVEHIRDVDFDSEGWNPANL